MWEWEKQSKKVNAQMPIPNQSNSKNKIPIRKTKKIAHLFFVDNMSIFHFAIKDFLINSITKFSITVLTRAKLCRDSQFLGATRFEPEYNVVELELYSMSIKNINL
jgi:hypothetical protein